MMFPPLSLSVQYATPAPELPRWRLRRWVQSALRQLAHLPGNPVHDRDVQQLILTLRIVDAEEGQALNRDYRQRDYATNVLTFAYGPAPDGTWQGDVVLCLPVLEREATERGRTLLEHAAHLTVHGLLHTLELDHIEADEAEHMEQLEIAVLARLGIPDPYLVTD